MAHACTKFVHCTCRECYDNPRCSNCGQQPESHDVTLEDYGDGAVNPQEFRPRDLAVVIADILGMVPVSHIELRESLESVRESSLFSAPELQRVRWQEAAYVLKHYFPTDEKDYEDWHHNIIRTWTNKVH